jgi:hypothetical protein
MAGTLSLADKLAWLAKVTEEEQTAKATRVSLEEEIAELYLGQLPEQGGSKTFTHEGVKFEVRRDFTFTADIEGIIGAGHSEDVLRVKTEFNASAYKSLCAEDPATAGRIAPFVSAKPGKASVKVKTEGWAV